MKEPLGLYLDVFLDAEKFWFVLMVRASSSVGESVQACVSEGFLRLLFFNAFWVQRGVASHSG